MKRILFVNAKRETCISTSPHLGLAMLSAILKNKGHEVLVVDYQFKHNAPPIEKFMSEFKPDVVGISLYTATMKEADIIIDDIFKFNVPILVGGPHTTHFTDELSRDSRIDYIFKGESENGIVSVIENAKHENPPKIVKSELPNPNKLPFPDFTSFYDYKNIRVCPLMISRGCPYNCSFCTVHMISSRKWRTREPEKCIAELKNAEKVLPKISTFYIVDDNPMVNKNRFKRFLDLYDSENFKFSLNISNVHAGTIDEELIQSLKKAGCSSVAIAVEHGNPKVFKQIGKGVTLEDTINAARLIKKHGLKLSLCFIIGLPGDSLSRTKDSINLAKELQPDKFIYWNMLLPFEGTRVYDWYQHHGKIISSVVNRTTLRDGDFMPEEPVVECPDFTTEERKKAYLMAIMQTNNYVLKVSHTPRLIPQVIKYNLYKEFYEWIGYKIKELFYLPVKSFRFVKNRVNNYIRGTKMENDYLKKSLEQFYYNPSQALWRAIEARLLSKLKYKQPILDIGCGDGSFSSLIFNKIDVGIDISEADIKNAEKRKIYYKLDVGDARFLPYKDDQFATVFSNCVIEHIPDVDKVLAEVSRVLQKGGQFIFTVPSDMFCEGLIGYFIFKRINKKLAKKICIKVNKRLNHYHCYSPNVWKEKLESNGMTIDKVEYYFPKSTEFAWNFIDEIFTFGLGQFRIYNLIRKLINIKTIPKKLIVRVWYPILRHWFNKEKEEQMGALLVISRKEGN